MDVRVITADLVWVSVLLVGGFFAMPSWMRAVKSVETLEDGNFFGGFDVICFGYEVELGN